MKRLLLATLMLSSPLVQASFHNMKVVEVFPGTAAAPNAQYVVLQMWTAGQNSVGGHMVTVYNSTGVLLGTGTFTFAGGVGNGSNQDKILIATAQAATFFNLSADLVMPSAVIPLSGGKVCFDASPMDCVAWGDYSGSSAGVGAPLNPVSAPIVGDGGLIPGRAAQRRLDIVLPDTTLASGVGTDENGMGASIRHRRTMPASPARFRRTPAAMAHSKASSSATTTTPTTVTPALPTAAK